MANEATYRSQALNVCGEFSGPSGSNANLSNNVSSVSHSTGASNGHSVNSATSQALPNCYAIVMLNQASTMLIRLMSPTTCSAVCNEADTLPPTCIMHHMSHWPSCGTQQSALFPDNNETVTRHYQTPTRRWSEYLCAHLLWTSGYIPQTVARNIRPVFLYRTVRRCLDALTRAAYHRRQQELIETGDTQPEELLMKVSQKITTSMNNSADEASDGGEVDERQESGSAQNFQQGVWEFMCHVFKSDLTRRELFRDTYSSDCMQSVDRLTSKSNTRVHKINWSVGSYGIFVRRKRKSSIKSPSAKRWHEFHANWLATHALSTSVTNVNSQPLSTKVALPVTNSLTTQDNLVKDDADISTPDAPGLMLPTTTASTSVPPEAVETKESGDADCNPVQSLLAPTSSDRPTVTEGSPATN